MGSSWEIDNSELISSSKCACGQGVVETFKVELSHKSVIRSKTEYQTEVCCPNSDCASKRK